MSQIFGLDAYAPSEVALRVAQVGVQKARLPIVTTVTLGVLAGGFIGLGAMAFTLVTADGSLGFATGRLLGGLAFSLGLILVTVAGAELFTGNNLLVLAWTAGGITTREVLRNWTIVFFANLAGAVGLAGLVLLSGHASLGGGAVAARAMAIAEAKVALPASEAFFRGVLCNLLVCLAVWMAMAARTVTDRVLAVVFPITAFVAAGFEHSIANMYFIPLGMALAWTGKASSSVPLGWTEFARNLIPVTLGNILGGSGLVGLVAWLAYRPGLPGAARDTDAERPPSPAPGAGGTP